MPVNVKLIEGTNIFEVEASGKLTKDDYSQFVPIFENEIREHGKIRVLFIMHDFHGWEMRAAWEDFKFDMKHFSDIEQLAIVGETRWERGMAIFCKPFTMASIRYFEHSNESGAREWIAGSTVPTREDSTQAEHQVYQDIKDLSASGSSTEKIIDPADLVRVYTLNDAGLADIISNALHAEGIPCFVGDELQAGLTGIFEVDLMVRSIDADRARSFIKKHEKMHKTTI